MAAAEALIVQNVQNVQNEREIRAVHDPETIRVYQAYGDRIADRALEAQTFVDPFRLDRMTWIKPSFLWMMYRSAWGRKDPDQKRILAIDITREGFEWALWNSSPSSGPSKSTSEAVRIQWDPERDLSLRRLPYRAIQIGLGPVASRHYVGEWIVRITEVSDLATRLEATRDPSLVPREIPYPVDPELAARLGMSRPSST